MMCFTITIYSQKYFTVTWHKRKISLKYQFQKGEPFIQYILNVFVEVIFLCKSLFSAQIKHST